MTDIIFLVSELDLFKLYRLLARQQLSVGFGHLALAGQLGGLPVLAAQLSQLLALALPEASGGLLTGRGPAVAGLALPPHFYGVDAQEVATVRLLLQALARRTLRGATGDGAADVVPVGVHLAAQCLL